jgi:hypothetical protein
MNELMNKNFALILFRIKILTKLEAIGQSKSSRPDIEAYKIEIFLLFIYKDSHPLILYTPLILVKDYQFL